MGGGGGGGGGVNKVLMKTVILCQEKHYPSQKFNFESESKKSLVLYMMFTYVYPLATGGWNWEN